MVVYKHVIFVFYFVYIKVSFAITTCEFHCLMCPHYNVLPGAILFVVKRAACV